MALYSCSWVAIATKRSWDRVGNCIVGCGFVDLLLVGCTLNHMKLLAIDYICPVHEYHIPLTGILTLFTVSLQITKLYPILRTNSTSCTEKLD